MNATRPSPFVCTPRELRQFCRQLRAARRIGLDTEFLSERRFTPDLGIIQVAVDDRCVIIDPQATPDLSDVYEVLSDCRIEKVLHAGRQDLEILHRLGGRVPSPVFDTQVAAALVGFGEQISYVRLVEELVGVTLTRHESFTRWDQRPLSGEQVEYALDDVRYLLAIADRLRDQLRHLGRIAWAKEEFARLEMEAGTARGTPTERYRQVRRWNTLSPRGLAVLRELAAWREVEAEQKNRPRGRIIPDELLVELARQAPTSQAALQSVRALNPGVVKRQGKEILAAIQRGLGVPDGELPSPPMRHAPETPPPGLVDLLATVLRARAEELRVAPGILAKRSDLERMAVDPTALDSVPVLRGWRLELVGRDLLDILKGRRLVGFDLKERKVKTFAWGTDDDQSQ